MLKALLLISAAIVLSYLVWYVFEPAIRGAEIFYKGAGLSMLQLCLVAIICICILAALAYLELKLKKRRTLIR